jgi:NAD-dependent SIR2 family protein deacetylase
MHDPARAGDQASALREAARLIAGAHGLLIAAGAGMGVDSGLPDFRGRDGFWRVYPALGEAGLAFEDIASPASFEHDPHLAWGFYGHRLQLYRRTEPHAGFGLLARWAARKPAGAFIFTSNVDGQFQKAGFGNDEIAEVHGSLQVLQCSIPCSERIWPAAGFEPRVDDQTCRLLGEPPRCSRCGAVARPNVLMFGDAKWVSARTDVQFGHLQRWLRKAGPVVVIEIGAGPTIATVRRFSESLRQPYVRINPHHWQVRDTQGVGIAGGALAVLQAIDARLDGA